MKAKRRARRRRADRGRARRRYHRGRSPDGGAGRDLSSAAEPARLRSLRGRYPQHRCRGRLRRRRAGDAGRARASSSRSPNSRSASWSICRAAFRGRPPTITPAAQPEVVMGRQLAGSRIGIIGYGSIGRYLADHRQGAGHGGSGRRSLCDRQRPRRSSTCRSTICSARADYVVCLAIANEQTENLIGQAALARMQKHAFFINLSRGNLVDEAALAAALRENRIAGAAIDVGRAPDQMPSPELAKLPNVIATPHVGGLTPPAIESQSLRNRASGRGDHRGRSSGRRRQCRHWSAVLDREAAGASVMLSATTRLETDRGDASSLLLRLADRRGDVRHHGDRRQCADRVLAVLSADHFRVRLGARRHRRRVLLRLRGVGRRQSADRAHDGPLRAARGDGARRGADGRRACCWRR